MSWQEGLSLPMCFPWWNTEGPSEQVCPARRMEWGREGEEMLQGISGPGLGGGGPRSSSVRQIQTLFRGLICLHESTRASYRACTDLSWPIVAAGFTQGQEAISPYPKETSNNQYHRIQRRLHCCHCIAIQGVRIGLQVWENPTIIWVHCFQNYLCATGPCLKVLTGCWNWERRRSRLSVRLKRYGGDGKTESMLSN